MIGIFEFLRSSREKNHGSGLQWTMRAREIDARGYEIALRTSWITRDKQKCQKRLSRGLSSLYNSGF